MVDGFVPRPISMRISRLLESSRDGRLALIRMVLWSLSESKNTKRRALHCMRSMFFALVALQKPEGPD